MFDIKIESEVIEATKRGFNGMIEENVDKLLNLGWDEKEVEVFLMELNDCCIRTDLCGIHQRKLSILISESRVIGSDLFNKMFMTNMVNRGDEKLKVLHTYYDLRLPKSPNLNNRENAYYGLVNKAVANSTIFDKKKVKVNIEPTSLQYFTHTILRRELNNNIISGYHGGKRGLKEMFVDGWSLCATNIKDIIRKSRYHQIGDIIEFEDGKLYNPKYNLKLLSNNSNFERIYNAGLELFLDEIVLEYAKELNAAGVGTITNLETYNYGKGKIFHRKYDVNTFDIWGSDYYNLDEQNGEVGAKGKKVNLAKMTTHRYRKYLKKYYKNIYYKEMKKIVKKVLKTYQQSITE